MSLSKQLLFAVIGILSILKVNAQQSHYECIAVNKDTLIKDIRLYGALLHQHQDFFNKAFSFQGIETGVMINHQFLFGVYGAAFVSNLEVKPVKTSMFVNIVKAGILVGKLSNEHKVLHGGCLLNIGYFSLKADSGNFALFASYETEIKINGLVLSPQLFAELNITKWMKLRTGLAWQFYSFENQSIITKEHLQNISLDFGFIFGKFD
jgi:hypothetical protein